MPKNPSHFKKGNALGGRYQKKDVSVGESNLTKEIPACHQERSTDWMFIAYPDSAPENWRDILHALHTPWVESPLHDKDLDPTDEEKKAHWHVLIIYPSLKSYAQVCKNIAGVCGSIPKICNNKKGMIRYFAHMDNPDKYQYGMDNIKCHGGAILSELAPLSKEAQKELRYDAIGEMYDYILENNIESFARFAKWAKDNRRDWHKLLCDNSALIIIGFIKSAHWEREKERERKAIQHQNNIRALHGMAVDESEIKDVYSGEGVLPSAWDVETEEIDPITGEILIKEVTQ